MLVEFNVHCVKTHGSLNKTGTTFITVGGIVEERGMMMTMTMTRIDDDDDDEE